jgi:holo-[acyl-carrier protein] synthase
MLVAGSRQLEGDPGPRRPAGGRGGSPISAPAILGIGIDLVDVARFGRVAARHDPGFIESLFPAAEIGWCAARRHRDRHLAARFAAREAVLKALGTGLVGLMSWRDIEVSPGDGPGTARMVLRGAVGEEAARQGVQRVHVAISVGRETAAAVVILEGE